VAAWASSGNQEKTERQNARGRSNAEDEEQRRSKNMVKLTQLREKKNISVKATMKYRENAGILSLH
jgi:hypothetical protein